MRGLSSRLRAYVGEPLFVSVHLAFFNGDGLNAIVECPILF